MAVKDMFENLKKSLDEKREEMYYERDARFLRREAKKISALKSDKEFQDGILFPNLAYYIDFNELSKERTLMVLHTCPKAIMNIDHPDKDMQMEAVTREGYAIAFIEDPDKEVQVAAVTHSPEALFDIKDPCREACLAAVSRNGMLVRRIPEEKLDKEMILTAIRQNPGAILELEKRGIKTDRDMWMTALRRDGSLIEKYNIDALKAAYLQKSAKEEMAKPLPDKELQIVAVRSSRMAVKYIDNPDFDVLMEAVTADPRSVMYMKEPLPKKVLETAEKDIMENPFSYTSGFSDREFFFKTSEHPDLTSMVERSLEMACIELERHGLSYADEKICVWCCGKGIDIEPSGKDEAVVYFNNKKLNENAHNMMPGSVFTGQRAEMYFFKKEKDNTISLYQIVNEKTSPKGPYKANVIGTGMTMGEAFRLLEDRLPPVRNMEEAERRKDIVTAVEEDMSSIGPKDRNIAK